MWKCFRCETINEGEVCVICGEKRPVVTQRAPEPAYTQPAPTPTPAPAWTPAPTPTAPVTSGDNSIKPMAIVLGVMGGVMTLSLMITLLF